MAVNEPRVVHTTAGGINVYVRPGFKKKWDFIVSYSKPNAEPYQVFHRDFIRDIYLKRRAAPGAFHALVDHLIEIINRAQGVTSFPPALVYFSQDHVRKLLRVGVPNAAGYDLELFLVSFELVQIQEETNYKPSKLPTQLYGTLRNNPEDLGEIVRLTEWNRPGRQATLIAELREIVGG